MKFSRHLHLLLLTLLLAAAGSSASPSPQAVSAGAPVQTVILPPKLVAGMPATLAVLGDDGRLAPGVGVELSGGQRVTTDATGRAVFTAPAAPGVLLARISDSTSGSAAVILPPTPPEQMNLTRVPQVISLHDRFTVSGANFRGEADADNVQIAGQPALVLAASPVALGILAGPHVAPGVVQLAVDVAGMSASTSTTLVALELETAKQGLAPGEKTTLLVRVKGGAQPLEVGIWNLSPDVVRFIGRYPEHILTSGGADNAVSFQIKGLRAGDFAFRARLISESLGPPDFDAARQFLQAALLVAPKNEQHRVEKSLHRLERQPNGSRKVRAEIEKFLAVQPPGDFTILLNAADNSLAGR